MATQRKDLGLPSDHQPAGLARLSGRMLGELAPGEQFLVWAVRQRLHDGRPASPVLVHGFRLAFGLSTIEAALAAFEGMFTSLAGHAFRTLGFCPLRCACLSVHEQQLLSLVAAAQLGRTFRVEALAARLVEAEAEDTLCRCVVSLADAQLRAGLMLPLAARVENVEAPRH